jgi:regulator of protease activity HflC (stomatin/prohibitin superfamily)
MRILAEGLFTLSLAFLSVRLGWPWPIVFVIGYLFAFGMKWLFLSRRVAISTRFVCFLLIFTTIGLFAGWAISEFLFLEKTQIEVIARSKLLDFFLGTEPSKVFWSVIGGIAVPTLFSALALLPYGYMAAQAMYGQYEQYKGHKLQATYSAISILLGVNRGTWLVTDGKKQVSGGETGSLARFGGPGILIVQEGHAVILEKSGKLSRIVGRGLTWLEAFERVSMVVPLQARTEHVVVEQVATKDKVLIEKFEFWVFHRVDPGPEEEQTENGQYPFNENILLKKIWTMSGSDWRGSIKAVSETAARDVVGRYDLEQIVPIADAPRISFKAALTREINRVVKGFMGVEVVVVDIGRIEVPETVSAKLLEKWSVQQQVQIAEAQKFVEIAEGEARTQSLSSREAARAVAQKQMIIAIIQGLQTSPVLRRVIPDVLVRLRLLEALEKIAEDPATKLLLPHHLSLPSLDLGNLLDLETP